MLLRLLELYCAGIDSSHPRLKLDVAAGRTLPPTLIQAGGAEMLAADAIALADDIRTAGGELRAAVWPDQVHVFQALPRLTPEARPAMRHIAGFIAHALRDTTNRPGSGIIGMGLFGSDKRSRNAAAVITGAGSGIGAAFAVELAKRGGRVVCSDIDENAARATADAIGVDGGKALAALRRLSDRRRALPGRRRTGLVRRPADGGDQQRRRRRGRHCRSAR